MKKYLIAALVIIVLGLAAYFSRSYWMLVMPSEEVVVDTGMLETGSIEDNLTGEQQVVGGKISDNTNIVASYQSGNYAYIPSIGVKFQLPGGWKLCNDCQVWPWMNWSMLIETPEKDEQGNNVYVGFSSFSKRQIYLSEEEKRTLYKKYGNNYVFIGNDCGPGYCKNITNDFHISYEINFDFISISECIIGNDPELPDCDGIWQPKFDRETMLENTYNLFGTIENY